MSKPRRQRNRINGWLLLDKPKGLTSTQALGVVKRALSPEKAGHAGTLDPLATGLLPIALGEATKAINAAMDGKKVYRFTVAWGLETTTHDLEGEPVDRSDRRPSRSEIEAMLPDFLGVIDQVPPSFSAIKVDGQRAYDLARDGELVELPSRPIEIDRLELVGFETDAAQFEVQCGKGTYVRALARDFGRALACFGHVSDLRRVQVGPFGPDDLIPFSHFQRALSEDASRPSLEDLLTHVLPVKAALRDWPCVQVDPPRALSLRNGQSVLITGRTLPAEADFAFAQIRGDLIALGSIQKGKFTPKRVFHL